MTGFSEDNAPAYDAPMTKAAFLRWVQRQERRHELKDGRAIMQAVTSKRHNWICINFIATLRATLDPAGWATGLADIAVEIGEDIRHPDVLVERLADDGSALSTDKPVVLVEVLSKSSAGTDMTVKLAEYTSLATLEVYIAASQDEPILRVWQRDPASRTFPSKPQQIDGREQSLEVQALNISLPLAELYRGIATA